MRFRITIFYIEKIEIKNEYNTIDSLDKFYQLLISNFRSHVISIEREIRIFVIILYNLERMKEQYRNSIGKVVKIDDLLKIILLLYAFVNSFLLTLFRYAYKICVTLKKIYIYAIPNIMAYDT